MKVQIYKILNTKNNWCYIGSTINFEDRKRRHLKDLRNNNHHCLMLQKEYNKGTESNFIFSIIESVDEEYRHISEEWHIRQNIDKILNTELIPNRICKNTRVKIALKQSSLDLLELQYILITLINNKNITIKELLSDMSISESMFHHTVTMKTRNQLLLDEFTLKLIDKYKKIRSKGKLSGIYFKSPTGEILEVTNGIVNFAKKHNLNPGNLSSVKTGKRKSCQGWTLYAD